MARFLILALLASIIACVPESYAASGCHWLSGEALAPADMTRFTTCPVTDSDPKGLTWLGEVVEYKGYDDLDFSSADWPTKVASRWNGLAGILPSGRRLYVVVIDIRVVNGKPVFLYLSNNTRDVVFQPWSSSKFMAAMSAVSILRRDSNGRVGANATVDGIHMGDLITSIHSYRKTGNAPPNSNGIAGWFQDVAGRHNSNNLIRQWLHRPASETFGGTYGARWTPGSCVFSNPAGQTVEVTHLGSQMPNQLSNLTLAETLKRLATHSYLNEGRCPGVAFPNVTEEDIEVLFYGNPSRSGPGGMLSTRNTYLHEALGGIDNLNNKTAGLWRIFQKTGSGPNRGGEYILTSYVCLPQFEGGRQFVISIFVNDSEDNANDRLLLKQSLKCITKTLVPGFAAEN